YRADRGARRRTAPTPASRTSASSSGGNLPKTAPGRAAGPSLAQPPQARHQHRVVRQRARIVEQCVEQLVVARGGQPEPVPDRPLLGTGPAPPLAFEREDPLCQVVQWWPLRRHRATAVTGGRTVVIPGDRTGGKLARRRVRVVGAAGGHGARLRRGRDGSGPRAPQVTSRLRMCHMAAPTSNTTSPAMPRPAICHVIT